MGKVTGKKITKIIGLGKKKPSTDEQTSSAEEDVPTCGRRWSVGWGFGGGYVTQVLTFGEGHSFWDVATAFVGQPVNLGKVPYRHCSYN